MNRASLQSWNNRIKFIKQHKLPISAVAVFLLGVIIYFYGFCLSGGFNTFDVLHLSAWSIFIQLLGRSILSSLEMFVSHSDLTEILVEDKHFIHEHPCWIVLFVLVHVVAVVISLIAVFNFMGKRLRQMIKLWWSNRKNYSEDLFIFFDMNDSAWFLAQNIAKKKNNEKPVFIFIDEPEETGEESSGRGFFSLLRIRPFRKLTKTRMKSNHTQQYIKNAFFTCSSKNVSSKTLSPSRSTSSSQSLDIWNELSLENVKKAINKSEKNIHIFLLANDEDDNIRAAKNLLMDTVVQKRINNVTIYCKARNNYVNYATVNKGLQFRVKLIDDSALSVEHLKNMENDFGHFIAHPINFVKQNTNLGLVESKFTAMIIGCGQTGQDAFRFIYEFAAFLGPNGQKSPFTCYLLDKDMDRIESEMAREIPALHQKKGDNEIVKEIDSSDEIVFLHKDYKELNSINDNFLKHHIDELNYIVVAMGDDEQNITIATEIYEYAVRKRMNMVNFHIFVRSYTKEQEERLQSVVQFYKDAYVDGNNTITIFGQKEEIYTYENVIVDENKENLAKHYFAEYRKASAGLDEPLKDVTYYENEWKKKEADILNSKTLYSERIELIHKRSQNYANVLHAYTIFKLFDKAYEEEEKLPIVESCDFLAKVPEEDYKQCLRNLSILEHLRWMAAHYMAGFTFKEGKKNFRKKTHNNIKIFEKLDEKTQKYDYAVVYTTIKFLKEGKFNFYRPHSSSEILPLKP